jgi:hypothetical protein
LVEPIVGVEHIVCHPVADMAIRGLLIRLAAVSKRAAATGKA